MSRVLFIRHAETEMAGRFCGHSDPELNAQGRMQLAALTQLLSAEPIDTVYSSDLRRASSYCASDRCCSRDTAGVAAGTAGDGFRAVGRFALGAD